MTRVKFVLGDKRIGDFLPENRPMLGINDTIESAVCLIGSPMVAAIAVTDGTQTLKGAVPVKDIIEAVRRGKGSAPVSSITNFDFPVMDVDTPASHAYYFLKAGKKPFVGVTDGNSFLGLTFYDSLLG